MPYTCLMGTAVAEHDVMGYWDSAQFFQVVAVFARGYTDRACTTEGDLILQMARRSAGRSRAPQAYLTVSMWHSDMCGAAAEARKWTWQGSRY